MPAACTRGTEVEEVEQRRRTPDNWRIVGRDAGASALPIGG
jgi:hypothetical protein